MEKSDPEHHLSHSETAEPGCDNGKDFLKAELRDNLETARDVPAGHAGISMTPEEAALNRRVSRKMDICMLPLLSLLYLFNGLDKSNVGNAQTQGQSYSLLPSSLDGGLQFSPMGTPVAFYSRHCDLLRILTSRLSS
jgi:hypothetical protein